MQHDTTPRITRFTDPDGTPCVRVLLSDHISTVELYAEDYDWLMAQGVTSSWQAAVPNRKTRKRLRIYVQSRNPHKTPVQRIIRSKISTLRCKLAAWVGLKSVASASATSSAGTPVRAAIAVILAVPSRLAVNGS